MVRVRAEEGDLRLARITSGLVVAALALAACGAEKDYANDPRPPSPINVSASITNDKVTVSPAEFGAGPVTLLIANLTDETQRITVETQDLADEAGIKQQSSDINPQGTASLKVDVPEGEYVVAVEAAGIKEAKVTVGAERPSSQDQLLQP